MRHRAKSQLKIGHVFWFSAALIFFSAIRRELSFVPYLFISEGTVILGQTYEWWEDSVLLVVSLAALGALIYGWRYLWNILKGVPLTLYILTTSLVVLQYIGENEIGFSHDTGVVVEEVSEMLIYFIAFAYLVRFNILEFGSKLRSKLNQTDSKDIKTEDSEIPIFEPKRTI